MIRNSKIEQVNRYIYICFTSQLKVGGQMINDNNKKIFFSYRCELNMKISFPVIF